MHLASKSGSNEYVSRGSYHHAVPWSMQSILPLTVLHLQCVIRSTLTVYMTLHTETLQCELNTGH